VRWQGVAGTRSGLLRLLLVGWICGLITAMAVPGLVVERRSADVVEVPALVREGWIVADTRLNSPVALERHRFRLP
jgi:hypothetical protein